MPYIGTSPPSAPLTSSDITDGIVSEAKLATNSVSEAKMKDDAISLTELKAGTDGEVISWDASGNPVAIGAGSSGEFLKSQGAGSQPVFAAAGGGKVLQVHQDVITARETFTLAGTWSAVANLEVALTPASTDSFILVNFDLQVGPSGNSGTYVMCKLQHQIDGGTWTDTFIGDASGSTLRATGYVGEFTGTGASHANMGMTYKHATSTTDEVNYRLQVSGFNSRSFIVNGGSDTSSYVASTVSQITIIECDAN